MTDEKTESGTRPIHSGMSMVFYLPQHRTPSTRQPPALCCIRSTGCGVSGCQVWIFLGSPTLGSNPGPPAQQAGLTTTLLSCLGKCVTFCGLLLSLSPHQSTSYEWNKISYMAALFIHTYLQIYLNQKLVHPTTNIVLIFCRWNRIRWLFSQTTYDRIKAVG